MKNTKKWLALLLTLTLCLGACGVSNTSGEVSTNSSDETSVSSSVDNTVVSSETSASDSETQLSSETSVSTSTEASVSTETTVSAEPEPAEPEYKPLRDAVYDKIGGLVGCCLNSSTINKSKIWNIVTADFSAITFENELKPQSLLQYGSKCTNLTTAKINGKEITVPKLGFSTADKMCDKVLKWNKENPDRKIMIRGHVLVWHSQTPEYFFHEDYDKSKPLVDKDTMNLRLEWYIKSVLEHYCAEDSKYYGLFYGWDVVNEAISDGTGKLRTDKENANESKNADYHGSNSSWYKVYQSNEFIINAFKYANKYTPADVDLYYNDYNECNALKRAGIIELLKAIKAEEGAPGKGTRIDGMGMQGHYNVSYPSKYDVSSTAEMYCMYVDKVMITEFDLKASDSYDGSAASRETEYEKIRKQYQMLYNDIQYADSKDGVDFAGITFWGVSDKESWLQSTSNVGGGNTTGLKQCPLLFDSNYEKKSCYYVFAE